MLKSCIHINLFQWNTMYTWKVIATEEGVTLTEMILAATTQCCDMQTMHEETDNAPVYCNWSFAQKMSALGLGQCQMILMKHIDSLTVRVIYNLRVTNKPLPNTGAVPWCTHCTTNTGSLVRFPRSTSQSDETLNWGPRLHITFLCWWDVEDNLYLQQLAIQMKHYSGRNVDECVMAYLLTVSIIFWQLSRNGLNSYSYSCWLLFVCKCHFYIK